MSDNMNTTQVISTLKNAMRNPGNVMAASVLSNARRDQPVLFNQALTQFNNEQRQANRPQSTLQPAVIPQVAQQQPAISQQATVMPSADRVVTGVVVDDEMESLDEEIDASQEEPQANYDEFDEDVVSADEEDESIDDEEEQLPVEEEDFEDDASTIASLGLELEDDAAFATDDSDESAAPEEIASIEFLSFRHTLSLSIYLNSDEGRVYENGGVYYTTKQPLRRGKGIDGDATGSIRASLENFIEGVRAEGEGIRFGVGVTDTVIEKYIATQSNAIEDRLSATFDEESNASISVTSTSDTAESPWGSDARLVTRNISLSFPIPAIVSAGRKSKDELKMFASNLKIINNLVRTLQETANVESVQVHILIEDAVVLDMIQLFNSFVQEGNLPVFERGYARFTVKADDALGGEVAE